MVHRIRWKILAAALISSIACVWLAARLDPRWLFPLGLLLPAVLVGIWDVAQTSHSVLRNHPIIGHLRFLLEDLGPELHQYFVESNTDGHPFDRDLRALAYEWND